MPRRNAAQRGFSRGKRFFENLVREAIEAIPEEMKNRLENVAILIEEDRLSNSGEGEEEENGQELLGLYEGIPKKDRGFWYGNTLPDRIVIYRKPLERMSSTLSELRENIRQTVIHEIGHYFGFDEEELQQLEDGDI
ncbi:MAG: metallopeptidase family protein [Deltaproteobacteria bacterium]|nr:metallopeptidase family protein [Deltaproteobacteria bacterium]